MLIKRYTNIDDDICYLTLQDPETIDTWQNTTTFDS